METDNTVSTWPAAALSIALLLYVTFVLAPETAAGWYVPLNLAMAAAVVLAAHRLGLDRHDMGLDNWGPGFRLGVRVASAAAVVLVIGAALPLTRSWFDDARLAGVGLGGFLYRFFVRIPLGTALLEEIAFRGVLFGLLTKRVGTTAAAIGSSLVFGLWHIRPTLDLIAANDVTTDPIVEGLTVGAAVAGTFVAGLFFCWLRLRSDSLAAPFVVHVVVNSFATALAWLLFV